MELEKVAAAAFLDEMKKLTDSLTPEDSEKIASLFHVKLAEGLPTVDELAAIFKEAGFFDRAKGIAGMMGQTASYHLGNLGGGLADAGRAVAGAVKGMPGAVGNFIRGGNQNGIPMHSLAGQLGEGNAFSGMGQSLKQNVGSLAGSVAQKARSMWSGGQNEQGIPMMGMKQHLQEMNPGTGMMGSLKSNVPAAMAGGGSQVTAPPAPTRLGDAPAWASQRVPGGMMAPKLGAAPPMMGGMGGAPKPPPLPAKANPMHQALMQGMAGAKSNPFASMQLAGG